LPQLDIRNLGVRYATKTGTVDALSGVSLSMRDGDFVVAIGASGCGKTTLLNCIAGFLPATEGTIELDGRPVTGPSADRGVVFQKHALMPWLNVVDNVAFGLRMRGVDAAERRKLALEKLKLVGLEDFAERAIYELSGGMQQRVGIARALASDPELMLMDEPLGALDAFTRMRMQDEVLRLWQARHTTMLLVTHDIDEAIYMADRIVIMTPRPGRVERTIAVGLDRPRQRNSPEFLHLRSEILELLHFTGNATSETNGGMSPDQNAEGKLKLELQQLNRPVFSPPPACSRL